MEHSLCGRRRLGEIQPVKQLEVIGLKVKRAETPYYAFLKRTAKRVLRFHLPMPRVAAPWFRLLYHTHFFVKHALRRIIIIFYRSPLFRSRCSSVGSNLYLEQLPYISGNVQVRIGNNVTISGSMGIAGGRAFDSPELVIGDRVLHRAPSYIFSQSSHRSGRRSRSCGELFYCR